MHAMDEPETMSADRAIKIRKRIGLTRAQLARVLRLSQKNGYAKVKQWEAGESKVTGPVSLALEALESGWRPDDFDANAAGGEA